MKRVFIDTNIMLDLLAQRKPHFLEAKQLFTLAYGKKIQMSASSLSFINTHYVLRKFGVSEVRTRELLRDVCSICKSIKIDHDTITSAINSTFEDIEDGVQHLCALSARAEIIVTRNEKDFTASQLPVMSPAEFILFVGKQ